MSGWEWTEADASALSAAERGGWDLDGWDLEEAMPWVARRLRAAIAEIARWQDQCLAMQTERDELQAQLAATRAEIAQFNAVRVLDKPADEISRER